MQHVSDRLHVASYNIRKSVGTDWRRRPDRVLTVLRELDADVVALQEVDRRFGERTASLLPDVIATDTHYRPIRFGERPGSLGWHGNTLLVHRDARVLGYQRIKLPALEPRGAVLADIEVRGMTVRIVGMHLGLLGLWRRRQARAVLTGLEALEDPLPTIMMGDLNEWSVDGGCLALFARHHHVAAPGASFHSSRPLLALDRIIASLDLRVEASGVHLSTHSRLASDHLPAWARLAFAGQDAARKRHDMAQEADRALVTSGGLQPT